MMSSAPFEPSLRLQRRHAMNAGQQRADILTGCRGGALAVRLVDVAGSPEQASSPEQSAAARALLVSLRLVAHVGAFGRPFSLRSGCDLRPDAPRWVWHAREDDVEIAPPSLDQAIGLFEDCVARAEQAGLPVGSAWPGDTVTLRPNAELAKAIRSIYPLAD